ncbi:MAG: hypothetical protein KA781_01585 [Aquabacterium sp.]|nr:hypothetical protein [Aquabacterium sp.]
MFKTSSAACAAGWQATAINVSEQMRRNEKAIEIFLVKLQSSLGDTITGIIRICARRASTPCCRSDFLVLIELKNRHGLNQLLGLIAQAFRCGGTLFDQGSVLLGGGIHLADRAPYPSESLVS